MLDETTAGNPICDVCGNSGDTLPMLLYSTRVKEAWEDSNQLEDRYVCGDCKREKKYPAHWHFVR